MDNKHWVGEGGRGHWRWWVYSTETSALENQEAAGRPRRGSWAGCGRLIRPQRKGPNNRLRNGIVPWQIVCEWVGILGCPPHYTHTHTHAYTLTRTHTLA